MRESNRITRLAPSPTGALHLGNARTFLINWAMARQRGWRVVVRIEDLDTPRVKAGADQQAIDDLQWLGIDWDEGPRGQLEDLSPYHDCLSQLAQRGLLYPCTCTRKEIEEAQSAPHGIEHEMRYPGTCRPGEGSETSREYSVTDEHPSVAWRVVVPKGDMTFDDAFAGAQSIDVQQTIGDFVVATKAGLPAYQLAVVVDDAAAGVTDVIRGDDLLHSAARQLWLYDWLALSPLPRYWHLPLVVGEDGRRLAKRHGDTRLASYREASISAERVIGLIAFWSGISMSRQSMSAAAFADQFDIERLPRDAVTFTQEDHEWLMG